MKTETQALPLVTDSQFDSAYYYLNGDDLAQVELFKMLIASKVYQTLHNSETKTLFHEDCSYKVKKAFNEAHYLGVKVGLIDQPMTDTD